MSEKHFSFTFTPCATEILRVTADGQFIWAEYADALIEDGDFSGAPALQHILRKLRQLHAVNAQLLEALELALRSHGVMLLSDPPQDAWKTYGVEAKARAAIAAAKAPA